MSEEKSEKVALIAEIQAAIEQLIASESISEVEKMQIARGVLNAIAHGEREENRV